MRIATIHGRVALIDGAGSGAVDVEMASGGRFGPVEQACQAGRTSPSGGCRWPPPRRSTARASPFPASGR